MYLSHVFGSGPFIGASCISHMYLAVDHLLELHVSVTCIWQWTVYWSYMYLSHVLNFGSGPFIGAICICHMYLAVDRLLELHVSHMYLAVVDLLHFGRYRARAPDKRGY